MRLTDVATLRASRVITQPTPVSDLNNRIEGGFFFAVVVVGLLAGGYSGE